MQNIKALRDALEAQGHPGRRLGTFLIGDSNSPAYLVAQLEAYLEAARADLAAEQEFVGRMLRSVKRQDRFIAAVEKAERHGWEAVEWADNGQTAWMTRPTRDGFRSVIEINYDGVRRFNQNQD